MNVRRDGGHMADAPTETNSFGEASAAEVEIAIEKLKGRDSVGVTGDVLATAGGTIAGATAASAIAGAVGATTLLGSSTLASALGGVFVTTTPIGWVVGSAAVMGAAAYGISKLIRSGAHQDQVRADVRSRLTHKLKVMRQKATMKSPLKDLHARITLAVELGVLTEQRAEHLLSLVQKGKLNSEVALARVNGLLSNFAS